MVITGERAEEIKLKDELAPLRRLKEALVAGRSGHFERERLFNEELTDIAEAIDHLYLESRFEYGFNGRQTVLPDGTALADMYQRGVAAAETISRRRPAFAFELQRRRAEAANQDLIDAMMRGELEANTIVELSPYPEEATRVCDRRQLEDMGYKPDLKRGMVRIIRRENDDRLSLSTFSLDNSALALFAAMQTELGQTPDTDTTAMLGRPAVLNTEHTASELMAKLSQVYDNRLEHQTGRQHHRGREDMGGNSLAYVQAAKPAIDFYFAKLELLGRGWADESIGPDLAKLMQTMVDWRDRADNRPLLPHEVKLQLAAALSNRRLDETSAGIIKRALEVGCWASIVNQLENPNAIAAGTLNGILGSAYRAEAEGQRMIGCGGATSLFNISRAGAVEQIFGGLFKLEARYSFNRRMHCVVCQRPPKRDPKTKKAESQKWCGPCGICQGCDKKLKKKTI